MIEYNLSVSILDWWGLSTELVITWRSSTLETGTWARRATPYHSPTRTGSGWYPSTYLISYSILSYAWGSSKSDLGTDWLIDQDTFSSLSDNWWGSDRVKCAYVTLQCTDENPWQIDQLKSWHLYAKYCQRVAIFCNPCNVLISSFSLDFISIIALLPVALRKQVIRQSRQHLFGADR